MHSVASLLGIPLYLLQLLYYQVNITIIYHIDEFTGIQLLTVALDKSQVPPHHNHHQQATTTHIILSTAVTDMSVCTRCTGTKGF